MRLAVVADDLTGATDVGSMSAKAGHLTHVYAHDHFPGVGASAVCVLDTDSRFDEPEAAYAKVFEATRALVAAGAERFHNKTCSVFRGNVGAEFDAMLDALGEEFAVVVLGFPKNGRTTVGGVHYVNGVRLEDSPFRHDPVHPTTSSRLSDILGGQTARPVASLGQELVAEGPAALAESLAAARDRGGYLIVDVVDQAALATIAAAVKDVRVLCGSSALVEELALTWPAVDDPRAATRLETPLAGPGGVLVVAGSLTPQTLEQVDRARGAGILTLTLDTATVFSEDDGQRQVATLAHAAKDALARGQSVLVHADNRPAAVRATQAAGAALGLGRAATGRLVSQALAEVAASCRDEVGLARLVVAGGDTSAALCRRLGVHALKVLAEVAPGVPACQALVGGPGGGRPQAGRRPATQPLVAVFKSGSFGGPSFLLDAVAHLQEVD